MMWPGLCAVPVHRRSLCLIGPDGRNSHHRSLRLRQLVRRLRTPGKEGTMTARSEVVALLTDFDVEHTGAGQRFVHRDGRPFSAEETELIGSATDEDLRAAASHLAAAPQRLAELIAPYIQAVAEDTGDRRPPAERS
jgi:hypothetical protein